MLDRPARIRNSRPSARPTEACRSRRGRGRWRLPRTSPSFRSGWAAASLVVDGSSHARHKSHGLDRTSDREFGNRQRQPPRHRPIPPSTNHLETRADDRSPRCRDECGSCRTAAATPSRRRTSAGALGRRRWRRARGNGVHRLAAATNVAVSERYSDPRPNTAPASTPRRRTARRRQELLDGVGAHRDRDTARPRRPAAACSASRRSGSTATTSVTVSG